MVRRYKLSSIKNKEVGSPGTQDEDLSLLRLTMNSSHLTSGDSGKKTRATSCTTCRQVKLKCDLKDRYPNPCSRCTAQNSECRTDASFKRIPTRSRIRDLENQLNQLKRNRALERATPLPSIESSAESRHRTPSVSHTDDFLSPHTVSERHSYGSSSEGDKSQSDTKWLNVLESDSATPFALDDAVMPYTHMLELFQHFEDRYLPHFCILQPINSLRQLQFESHFLFWSIALVAARHHYRHAPYFNWMKEHVGRLRSEVFADAIQSLLDLQAVLLLCTFPHQGPAQAGWAQLGMTVNAARQMGLDKPHDDVEFGSLGLPYSVNRYPRHIRQLTWMKCFELDVQMSCWHGHLPSLTNSHSLRVVAGFCENIPMYLNYAAIVSTHTELAKGFITLEDALLNEQHTAHRLLPVLIERLNAVKSTWSSTWSLDAELELLIAKMYLYSSCLMHFEDSIHGNDSGQPFLDILHACTTAAIQLLTLQTTLNAEIVANLQVSGFCNDTHPLPGRSEHTRRSAYFASCLLLRFLEQPQQGSKEEGEAARNAFGKAYQMFAQCPASKGSEGEVVIRALGIVGRMVGREFHQSRPLVTSRMGASIRLNIMSLAASLQTVESQTEVAELSDDILLQRATMMPFIAEVPSLALNPHLYSTANSANQSIPFADLIWDSTTASTPAMALGFDGWGQSTFDSWHSAIAYPASTGAAFDPLHEATTMA